MGSHLENNLIGNTVTKTNIEIDNSTINKNLQNELQIIGLKDIKTDTAIRFWHGTQSQWEQGDGILYYNWHNQGLIEREHIIDNYSDGFIPTLYVDGKFIGLTNSGAIKISYDTINWSSISTGIQNGNLIYGNNIFAIYNESNLYTSSNLTNWTSIDISSYGNISKILFGNDIFMIQSGGKLYTTSDFTNWSELNEDISGIRGGIVYANGAYAYQKYKSGSSSNTIYQIRLSSDNGETWNDFATYNRGYGDPYINAIGNIIFWSESSTCPGTSDGGSTLRNDIPRYYLMNAIYSNEIYVTNYSGNTYTSSDGINWSILTSSPYNAKPCYYDGNLFLFADYGSRYDSGATIYYQKIATYTSDNLNYYTTENPALLESTVYLDIDDPASLTIAHTDNNAIKLSNNKILFYNASGNKSTTPSVGNTHPNWICFIDNVGVKIGDTIIANKTI